MCVCVCVRAGSALEEVCLLMRLSVESGWGEWLRLFEGRKRLLKMSHREKELFFFLAGTPRKTLLGFLFPADLKKKDAFQNLQPLLIIPISPGDE